MRGGTVWELEIPGGAMPGLPVRLHLVEAGTQRGIEASAQVSWHDYREALHSLSQEPRNAERVLDALVRSGFSPLALALGL